MEEVIRKIIQVEMKAQQVDKDLAQTVQQRKMKQQERLTVLQKTIQLKANAKLEAIRKSEEEEINQLIRKKEADCNKRLAVIERQAADKMDVWVDDLVAEVLKRG